MTSGGDAVESFFAGYVEDDGRVVRHDEGDDTVSEGQAYAMLLAVAAGDRARFQRVWSWTKEHLRRPDGLLAWRWKDGKVADPSPATDADLDAARALVQAGRRFASPLLGREGARIATAVLEHETLELGGQLVLVAGPWAVKGRIVNPSYVSPCTYAELGAHTGDGRWERLRDSGLGMARAWAAEGRLPPDWAKVVEGARLEPIGSPGRPERGPRNGLDAARLPFRLSEGCDEEATELAGQFWDRLRVLEGGGAALAYGLDKRRLEPAEHPLGLGLRGRPRSPPVAMTTLNRSLTGPPTSSAVTPPTTGQPCWRSARCSLEGAKGE